MLIDINSLANELIPLCKSLCDSFVSSCDSNLKSCDNLSPLVNLFI